MAYGLWLYKEIVNDTGKKTRLEIEKRDYSGQSYEITALSGDIVLSIDGGSATDPIVKSNLSFSIIDTAQVTYSDFFTPDANLYKVKVYDVNGQTQTVRWTGFVTPDSFGEPLTYRGQINLTARDNLGYLNDLDFDYNNATAESYASIKNIINAAVTKIGGMPLVWNVAKKASTAEDGTFDNIEDAIVSTYTMLGDTWGNVVSELLKGIGCQLRYIDNNTFAVYDIEVLSNSATFAAQQIRFLEQSGYREIQPAWKKGVFGQDYGLLTEFPFRYPHSFSGDIIRQYEQSAVFKMQSSTDEWDVHSGSAQWGLYSPYGDIISHDTDALYIPYLNVDDVVRRNVFAEKGIVLSKDDAPVTITATIVPVRYSGVSRHTRAGETYWGGLNALGTSYLKATEENTIPFNVVFHSDNGNTYYMREQWLLESELEDNDKTMSVGFIYDPRNSTDVEIKINCHTFPSSGTLAIRFYPPSGKFNMLINRQHIEFICDFNICVKIKNIELKLDTDTPSARSRQALISNTHNVSDEAEYVFGQTPKGTYGIVFYKGGIYKNINDVYIAYSHFKRNSSASVTDNLLDLIGRETIQYHKKSWDILSGMVQVTDRTSVMRFGTLTYGGKRYLPISAALNLLANQMSVTLMLEIENYTEEASIVFSDYAGKSSYSSRSGGGSSSGGSGTSISSHNQLAGRGEDDAHPLSAITGLSDFKNLFDSMFVKKPKTGGGYYIEAQMDFVSILGVTAYGNGSGGGGAGNAVWGGIIGTLSNQTDLMAALAGKSNVGHTHAYDTISGRPSLALVATSGSYNDLTNKPTIPSLTGYATQSWVQEQGYLTAITKTMVENVLTGNISSHTHSYLPLSGGTMTGAISGATNITASGSVYCNVIRDAAGNYSLGSDGVGNVSIGTTAVQHTIRFFTASGEVTRITNIGNVGIGTTTPSEKLEIKGGKLKLTSADGTKSVTLELDNSGNLKINGNVFATGAVTAYQSN